MLPAANDAVPGVTEIEVSIGAVTVSVADPLIVPVAALMVVVPFANVAAKPVLLIVATVVVDDVHVALLVRFFVDPSL